METLIGKTIRFFGANYAGRINQTGKVISVLPAPYRTSNYLQIKLDNGFSYTLHINDYSRLLKDGILPESKMLIGDAMEITIIN